MRKDANARHLNGLEIQNGATESELSPGPEQQKERFSF